jgi:hypothetical protein
MWDCLVQELESLRTQLSALQESSAKIKAELDKKLATAQVGAEYGTHIMIFPNNFPVGCLGAEAHTCS